MSTKVPVAVIGVGYLGKFHAEKYALSENADLRAVVDVDEARAREVAAKCQTQARADYHGLF
ncbi:MAG: Gfo/Idh/MocA family oxidoreductase, partial [Candidatus Binatia bacterium]